MRDTIQSTNPFTNRLVRGLSAALLSTALLTTSFASSAYAHDRSGVRHSHVGPKHHKKRHIRGHHRKHHRRSNRGINGGDLLVGGIIGLAIGTVISDINRNREYRADRYREVYTPPPGRPVYEGYEIEEEIIYRERIERPRDYRNGRRYRTVERHSLDDLDRHYVRTPEPPVPPLHTAPSDSGPKVITYEQTASLEPWTDGWMAYCVRKFRSFDRKTGTYLGYDGNRHFCVPK